MKSSAEKVRKSLGYTKAEFLNFSIYLSFPKYPNLKIWQPRKSARTFVLANARAIFYIHCCH